MGSQANNTSRFPNVPEYHDDHTSLLQKMVKVVQNTMLGKTNNAFSVTLTANASSTVVSIPKDSIGQSSVIHFMPQTANAAAEQAAGTMYVSSRSIATGSDANSTITITHANNAQTDRTFGYTITG